MRKPLLDGFVGLCAGALVLVGCPGCPDTKQAAPVAPAPAPGTPAPPMPSGGETPAPAGKGTIKGRVIVATPRTPPEKVKVDKDPEICGNEHDPASLHVGDGGALESCVVYVKGPKAPGDWDKTGAFEIDQKGCHYTPRVLIVPVGATVTFKSSDPVLHNVKSVYKGFNAGVTKDNPQKLVCDQADFAGLQCNVHPFMSGLLVVAENPWYALTDASGSFTLKDVPAGTWKLFARHEVLGKNAREGTAVTVEPNKEITLDLKFD